MQGGTQVVLSLQLCIFGLVYPTIHCFILLLSVSQIYSNVSPAEVVICVPPATNHDKSVGLEFNGMPD